MLRFRRHRPSTAPAPAETAESYVERFRGTEWDTGFDRQPSAAFDGVSALTGLLVGAIVFAILIVFWLLLGGPVP